MQAMRSSHVEKNQPAAGAGHRTRSIYSNSNYQLDVLSNRDRDGKGKGDQKHTSSEQQSDHPTPESINIRNHANHNPLSSSKTHIKRLNRTIPHNIRPNPSHTAHNNMIINSNATRPEPSTRLRVRVSGMVFKGYARSAMQRRLRGVRGIALVSTPVGGYYGGDGAGCCGGGGCGALGRAILAVGVCRGRIGMDGIECGEGLGIWVWGGGVWLRCRSGLLGCWLHPLDAVRDKGVGDLLGGIDVCQFCCWGSMRLG